ncbi:hypothetical protein DQ04_03521090 [Trypanosoma grayi]|uniref:hypothetical protein n=1 Tax=Trypanosoma grayi TaxID=71804 RepID=UPI0004F4511C|nr:hypothetical protein DQ04_03521090 [Trypanosoma grayi]KEG10605.1 hypothetical protein DQ04_03521090 [Trypanosoma grayi]
MSCSPTKSEQTRPPGVPVTYYETCRRIECLASLGMPQSTSHTVPAKQQVMTLPEPPVHEKAERVLRAASPPTPIGGSRSMIRSSRSPTSRLFGRKKPRVDSFDMYMAYAALIQRLEQQVDEEEHKGQLKQRLSISI